MKIIQTEIKGVLNLEPNIFEDDRGYFMETYHRKKCDQQGINTEFYAPDDEGGILWSDPDLGIDWPVTDPLISAKDIQYPCLRDVPLGRLRVNQDRI